MSETYRPFSDCMKALFGSDVLNPLIGKKLRAVALSADKESMDVTIDGGAVFRVGVEGDCCSRSWIEHLTVPDDVDGSEVLAVGEDSMGEVENSPDYDCLRLYNAIIRTNRGDIIMEFRNSSNGYYGGYLVTHGWQPEGTWQSTS